jgi:CMP-N,N'-diacetyllegionaminic acid synthase
MGILAIITARGGSKGVPRKNIREFRGSPLIEWTIKAAQGSEFIDDVILSSDDAEIINLAKQNDCNVPFVRSSNLSQDSTPSIEVVLDAINRYPNFDWVILLQPTSPLRNSSHIDEAIKLCMKQKSMSCASVTEVNQSPYWMFSLDDDKSMSPIVPGVLPKRRQELPPIYRLNGAIYIANVNWLKEYKTFVGDATTGYVMSNKSSLDIDKEEDFNK